MFTFIQKLFDVGDFPARWHCGRWTTGHGLLHIVSDSAIFAAYLAIPCCLAYALHKRRDVPHPLPRLLGMFVAFVAFCGITHLNEAIIFWHPFYRFQGVTKLATAVVSWGTVLALVPALPALLALRTSESLEREVRSTTEALRRQRDEAERLATALATTNQALSRAEAQFRDLYDTAPDMYASIDAATGTILRCNATLADAMGYTKEALQGLPIRTLYDPGCLPALSEAMAGFDQAGRLDDVALSLRTKSGDRLQVSLSLRAERDDRGRIVAHRAAFRDVTETRRAEALFELAVEASPSGMVVVDERGEMVLVNAETERLFGYAREELVGRGVEMLVPDAERAGHAALRASYTRNSEQRKMGAGKALHGRRKDGTSFPVEVGLNPLATASKRLVLSAVVDRTETVDQQRKLEASMRELQRSNAELEQFAYAASHDLQEPLRMVASFSQLLARRYRGKLDAEADEYIHYMVDGANRMRGLINDLLAYSRVGRREAGFAEVDAASVVAQAVATLRLAIQETGARISHGDLPVVVGDRTQLAQVFQNLIGNAIKFRGEAPPEIEIAIVDVGDEGFGFSVRDNGIGIDPEHAGHIFEMFQRLHERDRFEGTGIGLALVKKIVERHGGRIWVESAAGAGATFFFTLSRAPGGNSA